MDVRLLDCGVFVHRCWLLRAMMTEEGFPWSMGHVPMENEKHGAEADAQKEKMTHHSCAGHTRNLSHL